MRVDGLVSVSARDGERKRDRVVSCDQSVSE